METVGSIRVSCGGLRGIADSGGATQIGPLGEF